MPEDQNANGEHWTKESVSILKQLGWTQKGSTNFDVECTHHVKERKGHKHGVDSFFQYYDPYYQTEQGVLVESKNWQFNSITTANIKKWIQQITDCMECMQVSPTIQDLSQAPIQNAVLMCWANDEYAHSTFIERLNKVGIGSKKYPCNIFVASNYEILRWCSLINSVNSIKRDAKAFNFIYPNVPTLGTSLIKAEHLTLTHLYSKYIFAEVKQEVGNYHGGNDVIDKLVVFCYEPVSSLSLDFLYDLIRRLNFQSYPVYEIYLNEKETSIRQIVADFKTRINTQIKGDIKNPSTIEVKYLDMFDGLNNVPDGIIHFGEV
ncbi:MAG: hypothetical protein FNP40_13925 [Dehalobacter sp. 4CP]|uniref:hypothetical protein n=1 Tax=Dehalobacter sp. CP TaxID=2594474 RepID=UPI0013C61EA4|nr:hypothetical protein [Dehalobacter sp. 4CP]